MSYTPVGWKNRAVEKPMTYILIENGDGTVTLERSPGEVFEHGTPVNAENLNHMDEGIITLSKTLSNEIIPSINEKALARDLNETDEEIAALHEMLSNEIIPSINEKALARDLKETDEEIAALSKTLSNEIIPSINEKALARDLNETDEKIAALSEKVSNTLILNDDGSIGVRNVAQTRANLGLSDAAVGLMAYPVGSIYLSVNSTSPASMFGGTWTQLQNRFLLGAGSSYANGTTGGEATHTLTTNEMPYHNHNTALGYESVSAGSDKHVAAWSYYNDGVSGNVTSGNGSGWAHNNLPPYLVVYMWKRVS